MVDVKLHDIGEGMTEGEVIHLFVKVGDHVKVDEPLVEVQTDKMTAELPSPAAGQVKKILIRTGDVIEVGATMVVIDSGDGSESVKEAPKSTPTEEKVTKKQSRKTTMTIEKQKGPKRILAAPHTRKLARELSVNLEEVVGSGRLGRITDEDLHTHSNKGEEDITSRFEAEEPIGASYKDIPFKGRRKAIADRMTQSLFTIPHVTHFDEADITDLLKLKDTLKKMDAKKQTSNNVSIAAFFIKAIALALKEFPIFNARLDEEKAVIRMEKAVHMGLATDTEEGLIVPVIHNADSKSMTTIHKEMKDLIKKAKENRLRHNDMTGSTFTISNVGPLGSTGATPIINYPEVGLMAFHKTKRMPVVDDDDQIVIRSMMNLSMSFDHRVADGGKAVAFTNKVIDYLGHPELMLVELK